MNKHIGIILIIILLVGFFGYPSNAQKIKQGIEYKPNIEAYLKADTLVWYGWDFSNLKVCDRNAYGYMVKDEYIPLWLEKMNSLVSENKVFRQTGKAVFYSDLSTIQNLYKTQEPTFFETAANYSIPIDSLKRLPGRQFKRSII